MSTAAHFDVEQFAAHVARLQHEHATRSPAEAIMRSRAAFRSWGERLPASLAACSREELVHAHRAEWLRDAECTVRTLDPAAFVGGTFHIIDGREIGMTQRAYLGFTTPGMNTLAKDYLPRTARNPVAAVAVNVEAVAAATVDVVCRQPAAARDAIRAAVACIAAHEYGHHLVAVVEGRTAPAGAMIEHTVSRLNSSGHDKPHNARAHGGPWCRAYAHLIRRAAFLTHHTVWIDRYRQDVRHAANVDPDDVLDVLHPEFARFTCDDALADILRAPAPAAFTRLFDTPTE